MSDGTFFYADRPTATKGTGTFVVVLDLADRFVSICNIWNPNYSFGVTDRDIRLAVRRFI